MSYRSEKSRRSFCRGSTALLMLVLASVVGSVRADTPAASKEYQVKAACLFNFVQFIEWPDGTFPDAETPISIGILGDDPFGRVLDQIVEGESIQGRKLVIRRSRDVREMKSCNLVFVSRSEKDRATEILSELRNLAVAPVGEVDRFAQRGGVINFYLDEKKVRFEINPDAAKSRGLKISSHLLKLGRIVKGDD